MALSGVALLVFGLSGGAGGFSSVRIYQDSDRLQMAVGAALAVGGALIYWKGWPLK